MKLKYQAYCKHCKREVDIKGPMPALDGKTTDGICIQCGAPINSANKPEVIEKTKADFKPEVKADTPAVKSDVPVAGTITPVAVIDKPVIPKV